MSTPTRSILTGTPLEADPQASLLDLWHEARQAHSRADHLGRYGDAVEPARVQRARGRRDGLITAIALLTARPEAEIHEELQEGLAD